MLMKIKMALFSGPAGALPNRDYPWACVQWNSVRWGQVARSAGSAPVPRGLAHAQSAGAIQLRQRMGVHFWDDGRDDG